MIALFLSPDATTGLHVVHCLCPTCEVELAADGQSLTCWLCGSHYSAEDVLRSLLLGMAALGSARINIRASGVKAVA